MIDFDYKIYKMRDVLTKEEYDEVSELVKNFKIDLSKVNSSLGFLQWSNKIQNAFKMKHPDRYKRMVESNSYNYKDYQCLAELNKEIGIDEKDYFNFLMTYRTEELMSSRIVKIYDNAFRNILTDVFKKDVIDDRVLFGHFNVYPKNSFIVNHTDGPMANDRYFTILFFLNSGRKYEDGSLLKIYTNNEVVDIVPDFNDIVLLDHMNYNYYHEVTENLINDVRYSLYTPFKLDDYNNKLKQDI
jgi:Rps23 Pro-64 3,4-dihydroxylase Tpa1-like proline 4-hydroxylase